MARALRFLWVWREIFRLLLQVSELPVTEQYTSINDHLLESPAFRSLITVYDPQAVDMEASKPPNAIDQSSQLVGMLVNNVLLKAKVALQQESKYIGGVCHTLPEFELVPLLSY